jgi:glycosyltransferase involved in cell wall biosynthesis
MPTPIIALSKDWSEDPTSNHHVLRELAKTRRVVWLNSLSTRTPKLSSGRDLRKLGRKLQEFTQGPINVENDLWVTTPLVLPLPNNGIARAINRRILHTFIDRVRARLGIDRYQLWTFLPTTAPYLGMGEDLAVYYCVDEWTTFGGLDAAEVARLEKQLLERVDVTFATSTALVDKKRLVCPSTYLAPHGVDHAKFATALDPELELPADLAALPEPRVGFYGTLRPFLDYELIAGIARKRPDWSIVLIGQNFVDLSPLDGLPNIHLLGRRSHDQLPAYCKGFAVGLVPYRIDDQVQFINPLKLREYLASGIPVVSTAMPEVEALAGLATVFTTADDAVGAIERAIADDSPATRVARSAAMATSGWPARVARVAEIVDEIEEAKLTNGASRAA